MTAPAARYTPSKPGDSAVLDTYAREMHAAGMPLDRAREVALRLYIAGFSAGVGEYVADGPVTAEVSPADPRPTGVHPALIRTLQAEIGIVPELAVPDGPIASLRNDQLTDQCLNCGKRIYLVTAPGGGKKWTHDDGHDWITGCDVEVKP